MKLMASASKQLVLLIEMLVNGILNVIDMG